jgi:NitT/TauT family transport system substrate-binding protein
MTDARWHDFYDQMAAVGLFAAGLDVSRAYTTELVCHGLGTDLAD